MRTRALLLLVPVPAVAVVLGLAFGPWPVVALAAVVWGAFVLQVLSGRSAWSFLRYNRLRWRLLHGRGARPQGARRTVTVAARAPAGAPRVAWSHDGWAHADGYLRGLDQLAGRYHVTAFGTAARTRGEPPVTLELLPSLPYDEGIMLAGLEDLLKPFDVVWAGGSYEGTTMQALDARAAGGPAVVCYEWENVVANYGHVRHPLRERALREVDHFAASSITAKAVLELDGVEPERITIVPPLVDAPAYGDLELAALRAEGRRRWQIAEDETVLLFMGRAVWEKGLHTIAAAAATLAASPQPPKVTWLVAGEGDYLPEFERIVNHYGADESVRLAGAVGGRTRHVAYAASDALLLPSMPTPRWLEQFGRVIPEAFGFGLPVIGTASGAIPEVVGEAGVIVAPGDHLELADAAERLTDHALRERLSAEARRRAVEDYSGERYLERVVEAIETARSRRASAAAAPAPAP